MGTVCAATLLGSLVDLDMLNDQITGIKTFGIRIGLGVFEKGE